MCVKNWEPGQGVREEFLMSVRALQLSCKRTKERERSIENALVCCASIRW
jgi:hypothetical protein